MRTARVVVTAEPFGFGPASKMLAVAARLKKLGADVTVVARGTANELAVAGGLAALPERSPAARSAIDQADACLNVMNFDFTMSHDAGDLPTVYLDTLFWFWRHDPWASLRAAAYFAQWFPGVGLAVARASGRGGPTVEIVGPILPVVPKGSAAREDMILVNFGGLDSDYARVGLDTLFPRTVVEAILPVLRDRSRSRIVVAGGASTVAAVRDLIRPPDEAACLSPSRFQEMLRRATLLITTPGLEVPIEAFVARTPTVFLPPFSPTQAHQLAVFRRAGLASNCIGDFSHWVLPHDHTDEFAVVRALSDRYVSSRKFHADAMRTLEHMLQEGARRAAVERQDRFVSSCPTDGVDVVVGRIIELTARARTAAL